MALGKLWHVQHFTCVHCKHELGTSIFYEHDGLPYCVRDYQDMFLPKCAGCGDVILEVRSCFTQPFKILIFVFDCIVFVVSQRSDDCCQGEFACKNGVKI